MQRPRWFIGTARLVQSQLRFLMRSKKSQNLEVRQCDLEDGLAAWVRKRITVAKWCRRYRAGSVRANNRDDAPAHSE
jgi:hypothetical protein